MSNFDRIIRSIVVVILLTIYFLGEVRGFFGISIIIISIMFSFASITAFCPFYKSTNLSTYEAEDFMD
ncbi:DUF2892 domain-containing protein [Flaviramulus sp. BrNp1-15]|uniref:YgaP-like transmembrane domain n=1 Tax=Flaviramulus sp. BrNp1-15 TaxID=2916754 RepID=UPI001EE88EFB|nr:YgaP-like transmembrane domain [Flaviramulus sp. BrNp1-15]ULC58457.1 DUF2892 domain-containing protein [Flaviramulus sp. BrNp1-15]